MFYIDVNLLDFSDNIYNDVWFYKFYRCVILLNPNHNSRSWMFFIDEGIYFSYKFYNRTLYNLLYELKN